MYDDQKILKRFIKKIQSSLRLEDLYQSKNWTAHENRLFKVPANVFVWEVLLTMRYLSSMFIQDGNSKTLSNIVNFLKQLH